MKKVLNKKFLSVGLSVFLSFLFVVIVVNASSTISTNISTGGTLTVSGSSTFGDASTDVNLFTGTLQASTTALFTGAVTTYGAVTLGDAAGDVITLTGNASTTQALTVGGDFYIGGYATTTGATGNTVTKGNFGVGTTTNATEISGSSGATTTMYLTSTSATAGACIQLEGPNGTVFRTYATTAGPLYIESGSCK